MGADTPRYLSQNDTIMWMVEADPLLRSTIVGVVLLEHAPTWSDVVHRMEHVVHHVPALREKVVPVPLHPTTLRWVQDPDFDLSYHLRRVRLPGHPGEQHLYDYARTLAMSGFDRARPLWEFTLVDGLRGGKAGFVMKAHHVVTDGIGAVQLSAHLFDFEPNALPPPAPSTAVAGEPPHAASPVGSLQLWRDVIEHDIDGVVQLARKQVASVIPSLLHAISHPQETVAEVVETARSIGRTVAPTFDMLSPVMTDRKLVSHFRAVDVPLQTLHDAAAAAGGTLNDGFLAGITGGLRRYHEHHGATVDQLRVAMPISIREEADDAGGNHVTVLRFKVPVGIEDPADRIAALHAVAGTKRAERSLPHTEAIAGVLNTMPRGVLGSMLKRIDFLASNVPGVPTPMYLAGAEVERFYPFGPTAGSAVNVTLMSYRDLCCLGVNTDAAAIPDPDRFRSCLLAGFDEVLALAG